MRISDMFPNFLYMSPSERLGHVRFLRQSRIEASARAKAVEAEKLAAKRAKKKTAADKKADKLANVISQLSAEELTNLLSQLEED